MRSGFSPLIAIDTI